MKKRTEIWIEFGRCGDICGHSFSQFPARPFDGHYVRHFVEADPDQSAQITRLRCLLRRLIDPPKPKNPRKGSRP